MNELYDLNIALGPQDEIVVELAFMGETKDAYKICVKKLMVKILL